MRQPPANGTALMRELCRLFRLPADYGTRQGVACGAVRVTQALRRGRCLHRPANLRLPPRPVLAVGAACMAARAARPIHCKPTPIAPTVDNAHRASGPRSGLWWQLRWLRRLGCLRRGTFPRGEESPKRAGGCGPRSPFGPAACIPRGGISQAVTLHRAILPYTACPFPASRGPVESGNCYGYRTFLKGRTYCPGTQGNDCTQSFTRILPSFAVGARSGLLRRVRMLRKVGFAAHPKAPLCKGGCLAKRDWGIVTPPALDCCGRCICHRQHSLAGPP